MGYRVDTGIQYMRSMKKILLREMLLTEDVAVAVGVDIKTGKIYVVFYKEEDALYYKLAGFDHLKRKLGL